MGNKVRYVRQIPDGFSAFRNDFSLYSRSNDVRYLQVILAEENEKIIHELRRISKPSRRVYCKSSKIPIVKRGLGICIISTSKGIVTGEQAKRLRVGGELICYVW